jgi:hypothetical protein
MECREITRCARPYFAALAALLLTGGALAFPRWSLGPMLVNGCSGRHPCSEPSPQSGYPGSDRELIHKINIVGPTDDRDELSKKRAELEAAGFRQEDFEQAMSCNVISYCPKKAPDHRAWGSGFDAGFPGQILIAGHGLYNEHKKSVDGVDKISFIPRHSFDGCFVRNYSYRDDRIPLVISETQKAELPYRDPDGNGRTNDWAVVKLARELKGCHPYPLTSAPPPIRVGETLINISFPQEGMVKEVSGKEPIVQICHVKEIFRSEGGRGPTPFGLDCDGGGGGSGGLLLGWVPDPNGRGSRFEPRGMVFGSPASSSANNYLDYGFTDDPNHSSGTTALAVNNEFLWRALHMRAPVADEGGKETPSETFFRNLEKTMHRQ